MSTTTTRKAAKATTTPAEKAAARSAAAKKAAATRAAKKVAATREAAEAVVATRAYGSDPDLAEAAATAVTAHLTTDWDESPLDRLSVGMLVTAEEAEELRALGEDVPDAQIGEPDPIFTVTIPQDLVDDLVNEAHAEALVLNALHDVAARAAAPVDPVEEFDTENVPTTPVEEQAVEEDATEPQRIDDLGADVRKALDAARPGVWKMAGKRDYESTYKVAEDVWMTLDGRFFVAAVSKKEWLLVEVIAGDTVDQYGLVRGSAKSSVDALRLIQR